MLLRILVSTIVLIFVLLSFLIHDNYKNLYKYRDFSYPSSLKRDLIFEALLDTRSDIYRTFDKFYYNKNDENNINKVFLNINRKGNFEKARDNWHDKTLLGDLSKNNYFPSTINFDSTNNIFQKSQFRFRGKSDWHLRIEKPSLRIKLRHYENYNMMKHLNLTFPEGRGIIENYYADLISRKIGLIGHYGELVELYINNLNFGVYHLHSREDENLIRINKRMPGPILSGQNLKIDKWNIDDFEIVNLESISRNKDIFHKMINEINKPNKDIEDWNKLWKLINFEQTAKHVALNAILLNLHNDYWHNHEFFYDKTLGRIEPILNDTLSLGTYVYPRGYDRFSFKTFMSEEKADYKIPINQKTNPFFNKIISDTNFYHRKNQIILSLINDELSFKNQSKLISNIYNHIDNAVYRDKHKRYLAQRLNGPQIAKSSNYEYEIYKKNIFEFIKKRNLFLKEKLSENSLLFSLIDLKEFQNQKFIKIQYKGELPLELEKTFSNEIKLYVPSSKKFVKPNFEYITFHTGLEIIRNNDRFTNAKLGNDIFHDHHYVPAYQTYLLKVDNNFDKNKFKDLLQSKKNIFSQEILINKQLSINDIEYNKSTTHVWNYEKPFKQDIVFEKGDHDITEDIFVNKNQSLIIKDGSNLFLWPGVSIFSEGKVKIDGNQLGVVLKNKFSNQPWGNLSIIGEHSNGSYIKNTTIKGGSAKDIDNILFSGMINFFWNRDILLKDLIISNNSVGDDTIHFTKSQGNITNLEIFNCLSDCIDMDHSIYEIENLICTDSLNDGLDLMESIVSAYNLNFSKNMDKSISVGEASKLTVNGITITESNIGVASKDDSNVDLTNVKIENSNIGLDSYRKNTRYKSSGKISLKDYKLINNKLDLKFIDPSNINFNFKELNYIKN